MRSIRATLLLLVACIACPDTASAVEMQGVSTSVPQDRKAADDTAFKKLVQDAIDGKPMAQALVAAAALDSGGLAMALKFALLAAQQGVEVRVKPLAEWIVGQVYARGGEGIPQDYVESVVWFRRSAEKGFTQAEESLGIAYAQGKGVREDQSEATKWFRRAAEQNAPSAQCRLAASYAEGTGILQDYVLAHMWANIGAVQSEGDMQTRCLKLREGVEQLMTRDQIAEAQKRAREWMETLSRRKDKD